MLSKIDNIQLAAHAAVVLELAREKLRRDAILLKLDNKVDEGLQVVLGMVDIRATDLLMIRNLA